MEDYKEKYEQALENIKKIKEANKDNKELVDFIEYQYSELKESEDERTRKAILELVKQSSHILNPMNQKSMIAWLEKRVEQKLLNNDKYQTVSVKILDRLYESEKELERLKQGEQKPIAYFYCKYGGVMPLCSDCKRNHLNSKYKTEEIKTWIIPTLRCTKQCFSYIQQKPAGWSEKDEKMLNSIIDVLEVTPSARFVPIKREIMIPWLKSLKERMKRE